MKFAMTALIKRFAILAALLSPASVVAQDVIGSAIVGGRKIQILSDNTWKFEDRLAGSCFVVSANLDFCGENAGWRQYPNVGPQITAAFERRSGAEYAFFITEEIGKAAGINLDFVRSAVVSNLATGMGVDDADVPIFFADQVEFHGKEANRIAMQAKFKGVFFVMVYTIWVDEDSSGQVFTYTYGDQLRDSDVEMHEQVVRSLAFSED